MILSISVQTKIHTRIQDDKIYRMTSIQYTIKCENLNILEETVFVSFGS